MSPDIEISDSKTVSTEFINEIEVLTIERPECIASISLMGGQVLTFTPHGQHPLLWENQRLEIGPRAALRQGAPICWPWFGPLSQNPVEVSRQFNLKEPPSHGLVRDRIWELASLSESEEATDIVLALRLPELGLAIAAHYQFNDRLTCRLVSYNQSKVPLNISFALHTYFAVSDIAHISIHDLDGVPYLDSLERGAKHLQNGVVKFDREVDRIYYNTPPLIRIKDAGWNRTISVESAESHSSVVWNPWLEKSKRLGQFSLDSYKHMVCVETARAASDFMMLAPHSEESVTVSIRSVSH